MPRGDKMAEKEILKISYDDKDTNRVLITSVFLIILGYFFIIGNTIKPTDSYFLGLLFAIFIVLMYEYDELLKKVKKT